MLYSALILGLLSSFHCVGMCGPIALMLPTKRDNRLVQIFQITLYNFGRILTYTTVGILFGFLGKSLYLSGYQQRISIIIGLVMIAYIIIPKKVFNAIQNIGILGKGLRTLKNNIGVAFKSASNFKFLTIGLLNGLLPCGMVYLALLGAISYSTPTHSGLYMFMYGIGTVPLMSSIIIVKDFFTTKIRNKIQKLIPIVIFILGILFVVRGLGLGISYISPSNPSLQIGITNSGCE